jgi:hypothetical protein
MIKWIPLPNQPWEEIDEDQYLIYLPGSGRALTATHDAMQHYFSYHSEDTEHVYPYRYISHYAHINLPGEEDRP